MSGIFLNILELSISMMPVIGLLLIISPLINKIYTSTLRYWIWLVISMRLLLPFSLGEGWPVLFRLPSLDKLITEKPTIGEAASLKEGLVNPASFSDINLSLEIITTIYFIGFTIFLIYKLACYLVFIKSIKKYYRKPPAKIIEVATEIAQRVGLNIKKDLHNIYFCRKIPGPMVVGIIKPVLLLPDENYNEAKLRMILSHEMIHMKRSDTLYKLLLMIASAIHWFNPFVHLMSRRASRDMEISCDTKVLREASTEDKKAYSLMILDMASPRTDTRLSSFLTSFGAEKESLEARINNIFSSPKKKKGVIPLILVVLVAIFFGTAMQINYTPAHAESAKSAAYMSVSPDASNTDTPDDFGGKHGMPESKVIGFNGDSEVIQTQDDSNGNGKNQTGTPGTKQNVTLEKITSYTPTPIVPAAPAEIVVIDLNQLHSSEKSNDTVAAE